MYDPSKTNQDLIKAFSSVKHRIQEPEDSKVIHKKALNERDLIRNRLSKSKILSQSGNWVFDPESNRVFISEGARKLSGLLNLEWIILDTQKIPIPGHRYLLDRVLRDLIEKNTRDK